jgi:ubiquinone/menaquinone biosynthesis C-methylase UbiE
MRKAILTQDAKKGYDRDYIDKKFGGPDYTHAWIVKLLRPDREKRLLDIGCSQGYLLTEAVKSGLLAFGIDISQEAVNIARENSPSSKVVCGDAHKLDWEDNYFDYITNIGSLEHFRDIETSLKEMKRVMKPDGKACIMLPNLYYYRHIINKVLWKKDPTSHQEIERFASLREWRDMIEEGGFKVEEVYKYNKFNRSRLSVFLRSITIPILLSHHFVFICRKDMR